MKPILFLCLLVGYTQTAFGQGTWAEKSDCNLAIQSQYVATFSIGTKAYFYTGAATNNFFCYDQQADAWQAKADFPGPGREGAFSFSDTSAGYVGGGTPSLAQSIAYFDFYKYDPALAWSQKASYPDTAYYPFSFSVNDRGYVVSGLNMLAGNVSNFQFEYSKKCFEYNPISDTWLRRGDVPWTPCAQGFSTSIGSYAYCGGGSQFGSSTLQDWWRYNPSNDSWLAQASLPFQNGQFFKSNWAVYASDGTSASLWKFDPAVNTWMLNGALWPCDCNILSTNCSLLFYFSIGDYGYIVTTGTVCTRVRTYQYDASSLFSVLSYNPSAVCENETETVSISTNIGFDTSNYFKLVLKDLNYPQYDQVVDSIKASQAGSYTFRIGNVIPFSGMDTFWDYHVAIASTSPPMQTQAAGPIRLKKGATPILYMPTISICAGENLTMDGGTNSANFSQTYEWKYSGSSVGFARILSLSTINDGELTLSTTVLPTGCTFQDTTAIHVFSPPEVTIPDSMQSTCPYNLVILVPSPIIDSLAYSWYEGGNYIATSDSLLVSPTSTSFYTLLVSNISSGCYSASHAVISVNEPPSQPLCLVTADSNSTHNIIVWEKTDKAATDSFYIYKETSTGIYGIIGAVHGDSLSEFHDYGSDPRQSAQRYAIAVRDTCGNISPRSEYHNTIHLQYLGTGNLQWNSYEREASGTPVSTYDIFIDTSANGEWQPMATVSGTQTSVSDPHFAQHPGAFYRVRANMAFPCESSRAQFQGSFSNVINQQETSSPDISFERINIYPNPTSDIIGFESMSGKWKITDETGRFIMHGYSGRGHKVIDVNSLQTGVYFLFTGEYVSKFIKN